MLQLETEDMLPRTAPKPCEVALFNEAVKKPAVPEVSILLNAQQSQTGILSRVKETSKNQATYAMWKRQVLPKVSFALQPLDANSSVERDNTNCVTSTAKIAQTQSNVYPFRTATATITPLVSSASRERLHLHNTDEKENIPNEACTINMTNLISNRRSFPIYSNEKNSHDVLSICAGTQTDITSLTSSAVELDELQATPQIVTKMDITKLVDMMQEIRIEQVRLAQMCEALILQQQKHNQLKQNPVSSRPVCLRDIGTQCNNVKEGNLDIAQQNMDNLNRIAQFPSQRLAPTAQSTADNCNTPQKWAIRNILQKPTEKSMVMNELAVKYLPGDKLNELLYDTHISQQDTNFSPNTVPVHNIVNLENKNPNDISSASYKYLKKYRLLPNQNGYEDSQQQSIELSTVGRNQIHLPYLTVPLQREPQEAQILDLEHLRNQPKYF